MRGPFKYLSLFGEMNNSWNAGAGDDLMASGCGVPAVSVNKDQTKGCPDRTTCPGFSPVRASFSLESYSCRKRDQIIARDRIIKVGAELD
jgi:hypothetical protein